MRHKQKKHRWPITASLLAHSLLIVVALGFAAFGTRMALPDAMMVTIVSSMKGDSKTSEVVQKTASRPQVIAEVNKAKPRQFEDEKTLDVESPVEIGKPADQAKTMEKTPAAPTPSEDRGRTETVESSGSGPDSTGAEFASTGSQDDLAGFLLQVRETIQRHKQYPRRARLQGIEGTTQLRFRILPAGEATEIQVIQSSQSAILDEEAVATVKRVMRFPEPPVKSPLGILIRLPLVFHLEKGG